MAVNGITGAYQVKVTQDNGTKGGFFKSGKQPSTTFSYINPDGQTNNVTFAKMEGGSDNYYKKEVDDASTYLTAMNPYSTEENPNITPKEVFQIKENIAKNTKGSMIHYFCRGGSISNDSTKRNDYYQLLDLYSNSESDGGNNITPQEQSKVVDTFVKWYY